MMIGNWWDSAQRWRVLGHRTARASGASIASSQLAYRANCRERAWHGVSAVRVVNLIWVTVVEHRMASLVSSSSSSASSSLLLLLLLRLAVALLIGVLVAMQITTAGLPPPDYSDSDEDDDTGADLINLSPAPAAAASGDAGQARPTTLAYWLPL
eukprot:3933382-Rhodomonas_salina.1